MGCPYKLYVTLIKNMHNVLFIRHGVWQMFSPKNCCWLGRLLTIIGFCFTILDCPSVLLFFSWSDCLLVFSGWSGFSLFLSLDLFVVLTWASACINWPHVRTAFIVLSPSFSTGISRYPCFSRISPKICHIISYHWSPGLTELILSHPGIFPLSIIVQYEKNTGNNIPTL